jgi:hypothetical protein
MKSFAAMEEGIIMSDNVYIQMALQLALIFLAQPTVYAVIGTTTARILAQSGYSEVANGIIAWIVLIGCAVGSAWAGHLFLSNDPIFIFGTIVGAITLLLSGALHSLRPYLIYLDWVEQHVFNVVPPSPQQIATQRASRTTIPPTTSVEE